MQKKKQILQYKECLLFGANIMKLSPLDRAFVKWRPKLISAMVRIAHLLRVVEFRGTQANGPPVLGAVHADVTPGLPR